MIKLIQIDGDGCLLDYAVEPFHSSWDAIGMALPEERKTEWFAVRDLYYNQFCSAQTDEERQKVELRWFNHDLSLMRDIEVKALLESMGKIRYTCGADGFIREMRRMGKIIGILSSGLDFIIDIAAKEMRVDFYLCSEAEVRGGIFTGRGKQGVTMLNKHTHLPALWKKYDVIAENVCHMGDHLNDVICMEQAGLGIGVNVKDDRVRGFADACVTDFRHAIPLIKQYDLEHS